MVGRYERILAFMLVASLALNQAICPAAAISATGGSADSGEWRMSQTETVLAATFFGAGVALLVSSGFVEGEYEKVTGYRDVGGTQEPVVTKGGTNTDGMLIAGAALLFLGACFVVAPSMGGTDDSPPGDSSAEKVGFRLEVPAIEGQVAALGVSHGF